MYEKNPTSFYPHVHLVNNPIPISSNITESQGHDPDMFHTSGNTPLNSIVSTHRNAPTISNTFLKKSTNGNAPINGNASNSNGNAPLPQLKFLYKFTKNSKNQKRKKPKTKKTRT